MVMPVFFFFFFSAGCGRLTHTEFGRARAGNFSTHARLKPVSKPAANETPVNDYIMKCNFIP